MTGAGGLECTMLLLVISGEKHRKCVCPSWVSSPFALSLNIAGFVLQSPTVKTTTTGVQQGEKMQNKYACVPCNRTDDMCTYSGRSGSLVMTGTGSAGDRWRAVQSDWFFNGEDVCQSERGRQCGTC